MNLITTASGNNLDLDETQDQYEYVGEFLNKHVANGDVWMCLARLRARIAELESSQKIRDDAIDELEFALRRYMAKFGDCGGCYEQAKLVLDSLKEWRDLPPMPGKESR